MRCSARLGRALFSQKSRQRLLAVASRDRSRGKRFVVFSSIPVGLGNYRVGETTKIIRAFDQRLSTAHRESVPRGSRTGTQLQTTSRKLEIRHHKREMANWWREREILASEGVSRFRIRGKAWLLLLLLLVLRVSTGVTADPSVSEDADPILIRPLFVYENLIRGVHDYFNNTCIILFHDAPKTTGLREIDGLLSLQRYFSGTLNIRTSIMDFRTFKSRLGDTYNSIKRPLFVLLNDLEEIREQFARVSRWITMAYPTWLLFLRNDTKYEDFLSEVHVPFDCVFMIAQSDDRENGEVIGDVYRIGKEEDLRWMKFGEWDKERGFRGPRLGLYQRRHDLHGRTIRVVTVQDPPVSRVLRDTANRMVGIAGFFGEVIHLLQEGMNCTFSYTEAASWGVRLPNGTWTGSIKMLLEDEADLAATELMMTSDRLDAVKFTTPVYSTKCRVYIKKPDTMAVKWNAYLAPFALNTWNAIAMTILVVVLTISTIDSFSPSSVVPSSMPPRFAISEVMFFVFGALCGQGMEPSSLDPIRLAQLSIQLTAVVVLAAYSAALISFLAVKTFVMPFTTMEGMLEDGSYRFAVVGDSADYSFFQNTTDRILAIMFDKLMASETDLPVNYLDGLGRVCRESKYAFMTLDNMATVLQGAVECMLEPLDTMVQTTVAMAVPSQSPYRGIIDTNILVLRDSGILQRLMKAEWVTNSNRPKSGWSSVELEDAMPLLVFLAVAVLVAWLALLGEWLIYSRRRDSIPISETVRRASAAEPSVDRSRAAVARRSGRARLPAYGRRPVARRRVVVART
ncbi:glutamate receptor-like isoform X3 [Halictus rubicundus]|uniref:glutamate receptor-like isoform X3 n=1 Tax=Halictus rubicundus TaxID=77578 RepID=UPI0040364D57